MDVKKKKQLNWCCEWEVWGRISAIVVEVVGCFLTVIDVKKEMERIMLRHL